jgi:hypothetical protein
MSKSVTPDKERKTDRQKRLGVALRENLRKRKTQGQKREELKESLSEADLENIPCDIKAP